jgi:transcriptional repressor NrdR
MVEKRSGKVEPFSAGKLTRSIEIACAKRYLPVRAIDQIVEEIQQQALNEGRERIESGVIGQMVLSQLKTLDLVAYLRFASVYKDFEDLERFAAEAIGLEQNETDVSDFQGTLLPSLASSTVRRPSRRN